MQTTNRHNLGSRDQSSLTFYFQLSLFHLSTNLFVATGVFLNSTFKSAAFCTVFKLLNPLFISLHDNGPPYIYEVAEPLYNHLGMYVYVCTGSRSIHDSITTIKLTLFSTPKPKKS